MKLQRQDGRTEALRAFCRARGKQAIRLELAHNLSWLLGGRFQIGIAGSGGICDAVVTASEVILITTNIEAERLREEEVCSQEVTVRSYPWDDSAARLRLLEACCPPSCLCDTACDAELAELRMTLHAGQIAELRENCRIVSELVEKVCFEVAPGMSEFEIGGLTAQKVYAAGLEPIVLIAACDGRILRYRHPICTANRLEHFLMLSLGARRNGHYVSITRFVSFGKPEERILSAQRAVNRITAMLYAQTRPGVCCGELFRELRQAYADVGYPGEIALHHQGGAGGFQARESRVTQDSRQIIRAGQAFAWNPSVTGFKSEDMLLVGEAGNEILTRTPAFPHETVEYQGQAFSVPQILIR